MHAISMTFSLVLLLAPTAILAQPPAQTGEVEPAATNGGSSHTEHLSRLIRTLESEAERAELVAELKTLVEVQEQESEEPGPELADALEINEQAEQWKQKYTGFLEKHGLNASLVGYLTVTVVLLMATLLTLFAYKRLLGLGYRKLAPLITRYYLSGPRIAFYEWVMRLCGYLIILIIALGALLALWQVDVDRWISRNLQLIILQAVFSIVTVFAVGASIIELSNAAVEYLFRRKLSHQLARMNTLLPIVRNLLLATLFTLFGLTLLSQLGLDVVPLLAGAGVVGFAVGFAAQALIKDMLVGFIVILEDLIQVGDVATLGGKSGLVEKITVRKVQLRGLDGTVFTVPFSEVSIVANLTKNFSYYLLDLGVAYRENTDKVVEVLKDIDTEMGAEDEYKDLILEPIEILGVDRFADSAVMIKARIKTQPLKQWTVGREFNRRMKLAFDEQGIEMPFPHRTVYFGENKEGKAAPMRVDLLQNPSAPQQSANDQASPAGK
jgi:small-conductance mechanosensitive channel